VLQHGLAPFLHTLHQCFRRNFPIGSLVHVFKSQTGVLNLVTEPESCFDTEYDQEETDTDTELTDVNTDIDNAKGGVDTSVDVNGCDEKKLALIAGEDNA
jgi:hypothetical protein